MNTTQVSIPFEINHSQVVIQKHFQDALKFCAQAAGYEVDKQVVDAMGMSKASTSGWFNGQAMPKWPQLNQYMDICGNDAPLLWMLYQRGYDLASLHKRESEVESENRKLRAQLSALQNVVLEFGRKAA